MKTTINRSKVKTTIRWNKEVIGKMPVWKKEE